MLLEARNRLHLTCFTPLDETGTLEIIQDPLDLAADPCSFLHLIVLGKLPSGILFSISCSLLVLSNLALAAATDHVCFHHVRTDALVDADSGACSENGSDFGVELDVHFVLFRHFLVSNLDLLTHPLLEGLTDPGEDYDDDVLAAQMYLEAQRKEIRPESNEGNPTHRLRRMLKASSATATVTDQGESTYNFFGDGGQRLDDDLVDASELEDLLDRQALILGHHQVLDVLPQDPLSLSRSQILKVPDSNIIVMR
jgi:hypothetical protein